MLMPPRKKAFSGVQRLYYYYAALLSVQFGACYSGARTPVGVVGTDQQQQQQQNGVVARTNEEKNVEKCNFIMSCVLCRCLSLRNQKRSPRKMSPVHS